MLLALSAVALLVLARPTIITKVYICYEVVLEALRD